MTCKHLFINEDNLIQWEGMKNPADDSYVNSGETVTFTIKDSEDAVVGTANISMPYVAGSDGDYQGTFTKEDAADLARGEVYYLEITATGSVEGFRRVECIAVYHEED